MSNLIKYNSFVVRNEDNIIIDSNRMVLEKINSIKDSFRATAQAGKGVPDADGFVSGLNAQVVEELVASEDEALTLEGAKAEAEEILSDAHSQAEEIIEQAHKTADSFISAAKEQGYSEGLNKANVSLAKKIEQLESEYAEKERNLKAEYRKKIAQTEPMLVEALLEVFSKVTHTIAEDKKDMIICLINSVMKSTDISREFYIRVSPEDYNFALNNQDKIYNSVAKDVHIEISEDTSLGRNECIIETDAGVFDCSLDIQLENLISDIKLLSCMNE